MAPACHEVSNELATFGCISVEEDEEGKEEEEEEENR